MYDSWKEYAASAGKSDEDPVVMPWLFSKPFRQKYPERILEIKARFAGSYLTRNSQEFQRQMQANTSHDTRGILNRIHAPILIMVGKHDQLTPPSTVEKLKSEIPNAKLLILDEGGHGLYWEVPDSFNKAVLDFLNSQKN